MAFVSVLFSDASAAAPTPLAEPACFHDLNLDQIVAHVTAPWPDYDLLPFFHQPLREVDAIIFRQEVMRDLQQPPVIGAVRSFGAAMARMRRQLPKSTQHLYAYQQQRGTLAAAQIYITAVAELGNRIGTLPVTSRGLLALRDFFAGYVQSEAFERLRAAAAAVTAALDDVQYALLLNDDLVAVRAHEPADDYAAEVEATFDKFRRDAVRDYLSKLPEPGGMNHIDAQIIDRVALLYPAPFRALDEFCGQHGDFIHPTVARFDRESHFYIAWLDYLGPFIRSGLPFCYPTLSTTDKTTICRNAFDLALAEKLLHENAPVVRNDLTLSGPERFVVVTGPNQGGKTTFARMCGQLHYLAALGCPIPGSAAQLLLVDQIFTHFEQAESVTTLRGKLADDLVRIRDILQHVTPRSLVILNEIFSSTTLDDAVYLGRKILEQLAARNVVAVCVTFLDELAAPDARVVSLVAAVDPNDPAIRTFKLERRPADGIAYALAIARKHRVTYRDLLERIGAGRPACKPS